MKHALRKQCAFKSWAGVKLLQPLVLLLEGHQKERKANSVYVIEMSGGSSS